MATTSSRTLRLLSLLQQRRYWAGSDLADRLDVSVRTLRRDIERLRDLGYPVQAQPGVDGGYQLAAGAALPPLVLDDEEAVALVIGLQTATQGAVAGIEESSVRALAKVVQVMPAGLRRRVEALRAMTVPATLVDREAAVDPEILTVVAQACGDTERLTFSYTAGSGEHSEREVEPLRLVSLGRRWYLVAYDLSRHDWRSFRLDRVVSPNPTGARFRPRDLPAEDAAAYVRDRIEGLPAPFVIDVLIHGPEERVRRRLGTWADIEPTNGDRTRVRMTTDSLDWPAMALGSIGLDFTVLSPPELVSHLEDWARRFRRATRISDPSARSARPAPTSRPEAR